MIVSHVSYLQSKGNIMEKKVLSLFIINIVSNTLLYMNCRMLRSRYKRTLKEVDSLADTSKCLYCGDVWRNPEGDLMTYCKISGALKNLTKDECALDCEGEKVMNRGSKSRMSVEKLIKNK